ncbi:Hypothetical predicted protein [Paramuricea clavata]|uniref:Uncharacterized protein n=1 Tax=Paramuricea clavata TaxID=317549 RepID=A0A6S7KFX8_PARCT|nr:Hypothetical predicted protein [Paramuricea clavata]
MGSSCSILNDTHHDVWMTHEIDWELLIGVTRGLVTLCAIGASLLAHVAEKEGERGTSRNNVAAREITEKKTAGLTKNGWQNVASVLKMSDGVLSEFLSIPQSEAKKMKSAIKEFQEKAELIKPGEKYTWSGTLSLTMRVYVMNDKLQCDDKSCLTGPTANSERIYTISEYFKKLDMY